MLAVWRVAAAVALVMALVVVAGTPADAHAILLRTDPSPQSTVASAPSEVRLEFSESVEVAFGAIRVFDVNGHRVDTGAIRRAAGNTHVSVAVRRLTTGTFTVTWRVISADGHPVHGGFAFYVGAPSTISPVAVALDKGPGRVIGWGFGAVRFAWYAAVLGIVGMVAIRRWVWTPALRATGLDDGPAAARFRLLFRWALPGAWVVLAIAGVAEIVFQTASVSGLSLGSAARWAVVSEVLPTAYGNAWRAEMVLTALALVPVVALVRRRRVAGVSPTVWIVILGVLMAGLAVASAMEGHSRTGPHPNVEVVSLAAHLLAAGVWVGGLGALVVLGGSSWRRLGSADRVQVLRQLLPRFSRLAVGGVIVVVATGVVNSFGALDAVSDLWRVTYGRVLLIKIGLLALALVLAARHRWAVPRKLAAPSSGPATVASFTRSSVVETALLAGALAMAAGLVALVPARSLALAANGPVDLQQRVGPYTAQMFLDPSRVGANQVHLTFLNQQGLAAGEVSTVTVAVGRSPGALRPVAMRLLAPGHFAGDATFPVAGRYQLTARTTGAAPALTTTFRFRLRGSPARR